MSFRKHLIIATLLINPVLLAAEAQKEHKYTAREEIVFAHSSRVAFDRSGKILTHSIQADGSLRAEHNGSLGNVTVARLGANGEMETFCTTDEAAARSWMAGEHGVKPDASLTTSDLDK